MLFVFIVPAAEPGTRSQEPEFSEQNDFPTFSQIILLSLYADK